MCLKNGSLWNGEWLKNSYGLPPRQKEWIDSYTSSHNHGSQKWVTPMSSHLSKRTIFHFHEYGRKGKWVSYQTSLIRKISSIIHHPWKNELVDWTETSFILKNTDRQIPPYPDPITWATKSWAIKFPVISGLAYRTFHGQNQVAGKELRWWKGFSKKDR